METDLSLKEVQARIRVLNADILSLFKMFENETGLSIDDIKVQKFKNDTTDNTRIASVNITVKL